MIICLKPLRLPSPPPIPHLGGKGTVIYEAVMCPESMGSTYILNITLRGPDDLSSSWFGARTSLFGVSARTTIEMIPSSMILQSVSKRMAQFNEKMKKTKVCYCCMLV